MSDFFNKYPYTDFHELNLDWVIERVKKLTEDWLATQQEWNDTEEQWQQLYDYVHDYFDNLDVQDEINNKINAMIADGTFLNIIRSTVEAQTTTATENWLAAHITQPTTPAIDNTLTIAGAAADSKTVGEMFATAYDSTATYSQYQFTLHNGKLYRALQPITTPEAWDSTHWQRVIIGSEIKGQIYKAFGKYDADLNDCHEPGTYNLGSSCTNYPPQLSAPTNVTLFVFNGSAANGRYIHQFVMTSSTSVTYHRLIENNGSVIVPWEIFTDYEFIRNLETSPMQLVNFSRVRKWYRSSSGTETIFANPVQYVQYGIYNNPGTLNSTTSAIIAKSNEAIYTTPAAITAGDTVNTGLCLMITAPESQRYIITLMEFSANSWSPANRRISKNIYLTKGTHCIVLDGCTADNTMASGLNLQTIAVVPIYLTSAAAPLNFSLCKTPVLGSYSYEHPKYESGLGIIFWGDSLTRGSGGGGTTYCETCAKLLGMDTTFMNCGVGGETADTIAARQGGNNVIIPAGAVNGTYTLNQLVDRYGKQVSPLRQYMFQDTVNPVMINGQACNMTISQLDASDPNATYTISGYVGTIPYDVPALFSGSDKYADITVIFVGTNGFSDGINHRISVIRSMLTRVNDKYVIMGLSIGDSATMDADDDQMQEEFGNHFFPTRKMLVNFGLATQNLNPSAQDVIDIAAGTVPDSLRSDTTHLNANGYEALGKMLAAHIVGLGYASYKQ